MGTKTRPSLFHSSYHRTIVKKESPNMGTKTFIFVTSLSFYNSLVKKNPQTWGRKLHLIFADHFVILP